jgi:hypothetical protein
MLSHSLLRKRLKRSHGRTEYPARRFGKDWHHNRDSGVQLVRRTVAIVKQPRSCAADDGIEADEGNRAVESQPKDNDANEACSEQPENRGMSGGKQVMEQRARECRYQERASQYQRAAHHCLMADRSLETILPVEPP